MLDISVKALNKAVTSNKKAVAFLEKSFSIFEKLDGTKLTLLRNDQPFNPEDYTQNWIITYKGKIIYHTEFNGLESRNHEIKLESIGTSQYKFVHEHLKQIHYTTECIPNNTEFFIEFVQNKSTITRDYDIKHDLYLIGFGTSQYIVNDGQLYSSSAFENAPELLEKYRLILQLKEFPLIFKGKFSTHSEIIKGCRSNELRALFEKSLSSMSGDPLSIISLMNDTFSQLSSSLGGKAEGVIIQVNETRELYKILASDQHSKEVRALKKARFISSPEEEEEYWKNVLHISSSLLKDINHLNDETALFDISAKVYSLSDLPTHAIKTKLNIQDDIFLTAKLNLHYRKLSSVKKIGIIPMAAKPFHAGHDMLINQACQQCDITVVFVSVCEREELSSAIMLPIWKSHYLPGLQKKYGDKLIIVFSSSPFLDATQLIKNHAKIEHEVFFYGGVDQLGNDDSSKINEWKVKYLDRDLSITPVGISRISTNGISGTLMRQYLLTGEKTAFVNNLPNWLSPAEKSRIWNLLLRGIV
jgi:hypothetical protein